MATWADLKELRLTICDPSGVIGIEQVADEDALPASPIKQTAYQKIDSGEYVLWDEELEDWESLELEISDVRLEGLIDLYGVKRAASKAVSLVLVSVGKRLGIARSAAGAESVQYQTLSDLYSFYKALAKSLEEEATIDDGLSTGRYFKIHTHGIAGGMHG